jgi:hypothetical protein
MAPESPLREAFGDGVGPIGQRVSTWLVPEKVNVSDGTVKWSAPFRPCGSTEGLLGRFEQLRSPEGVGALASEYGPLRPFELIAGSFLPEEGEERVSDWLLLAHDITVLAEATMQVRRRRPVAAIKALGDLQAATCVPTESGRSLVASTWHPTVIYPWADESDSLTSTPQDVIVFYINCMLMVAPATFRYVWASQPEVRTTPSNLLCALAIQLGQVLARDEAPRLCPTCGLLFTAPGRRTYCFECQPPTTNGRRTRGEAQRRAEARARARAKEKD